MTLLQFNDLLSTIELSSLIDSVYASIKMLLISLGKFTMLSYTGDPFITVLLFAGLFTGGYFISDNILDRVHDNDLMDGK